MSEVFKNKRPLLLASASPRRRELLSLLGLEFSVRVAESESGPAPGESGPAYAARAAREKALAVLHQLAREWGAASGQHPRSASPPLSLPLILAADTIVLLDGEIFGKPATPEHSLAMLKRLAGREHQVITACHLLLPPSANAENAGTESAADLNALPASGAAIPEQPVQQHQLEQQEQRAALPYGYSEASLAQSSGVTFWNAPEAALRAYANSGTTLDKAGSYAMQGEGAWLVRQVQGSWSNVIGLPLSELTEFLLERNFITPCTN